MFGSQASGKAAVGSDVDVMVIGEAGFAEVVQSLYPAQATLGREINPKVYRLPEWQTLVAAQGAFVRDVQAKPRLLVMGSDSNLFDGVMDDADSQ